MYSDAPIYKKNNYVRRIIVYQDLSMLIRVTASLNIVRKILQLNAKDVLLDLNWDTSNHRQ